MKDRIESKEKDPLGTMLLDYYHGEKDAFVDVGSTTLDMWKMTGDVMFRSFKEMSYIEKKALGLCHGKVLDVGAGSGCHSLYLQKRNLTVTSVDISPGCFEIMRKRKLAHPKHGNLFSIQNKKFDTLLMLMNGIGICGSIDGLNLFFQFIKSILSPHGQIIADSTDLVKLYPLETLQTKDNTTYYGETQFIMSYKTIVGQTFDWLYIDFDTLSFYANLNEFFCEKIIEDKSGKYLARMIMK